MQIRFSTLALLDLEELYKYLPEKSPSGYLNVSSEIEATIKDIPSSLLRGRQTPIDGVWERITPHYKYIIPYCKRGEICYILRIYHSSRVGLDYEGDLDIEKGLGEK